MNLFHSRCSCGPNAANMVKPVFIVLFRGDDSDFQGNQDIEVKIETDMDLTGIKARFSLLSFRQDFDTIPEDKTLRLTFGAEETRKMPLGSFDATLWLEDANGNRRTVSNRIHVVVTNSVKEAYENESAQAVTVVVSGSANFVKTVNGVKPDADGNVNVSMKPPLAVSDVFDMECNDWDFRRVVARLWTELGGKVVNSGE